MTSRELVEITCGLSCLLSLGLLVILYAFLHLAGKISRDEEQRENNLAGHHLEK